MHLKVVFVVSVGEAGIEGCAQSRLRQSLTYLLSISYSKSVYELAIKSKLPQLCGYQCESASGNLDTIGPEHQNQGLSPSFRIVGGAGIHPHDTSARICPLLIVDLPL